jgi:hypothetical protein
MRRWALLIARDEASRMRSAPSIAARSRRRGDSTVGGCHIRAQRPRSGRCSSRTRPPRRTRTA